MLSRPAHGFAQRLLAWHRKQGRHDLPWQQAPTPYRVWVSEIMLQQTQVATVLGYYARFMARFPDLSTLAAADLDEVLHLWSGLGYYARARHLHRAARILMADHAGTFPRQMDAVRALPGIGRSTAGAILALAHGDRHPILDGNVKRVLTRHAAIEGWPEAPATQRVLWDLAETLTPQRQVARYTQAIMDLGATLCTRSQPDCGRCPVQSTCLAHARGAVTRYPSPRPRRILPERQTRVLMLTTDQVRWLLMRRPAPGIWGGLWSFPALDDADSPDEWLRRHGLAPHSAPRARPPVTHTFTHFKLTLLPIEMTVRIAAAGMRETDDLCWFDPRQPRALGLAAPVQRLLASAAVSGITAGL